MHCWFWLIGTFQLWIFYRKIQAQGRSKAFLWLLLSNWPTFLSLCVTVSVSTLLPIKCVQILVNNLNKILAKTQNFPVFHPKTCCFKNSDKTDSNIYRTGTYFKLKHNLNFSSVESRNSVRSERLLTTKKNIIQYLIIIQKTWFPDCDTVFFCCHHTCATGACSETFNDTFVRFPDSGINFWRASQTQGLETVESARKQKQDGGWHNNTKNEWNR